MMSTRSARSAATAVAGGVEGRQEPESAPSVGADFLAVETQPEEADLQTIDRSNRKGRGVADRLARRLVDHVRDDVLELRFRHPLQEDVLAEVELMIAERRDVEAHRVEAVDHLLAHEDGRGDRRGQEIAAERDQRRVSRRGDAAFQRGDAREAAPAVDRHRFVDVVDVEQRELRAAGRRTRLLRRGVAGDQEPEGDDPRGEPRHCGASHDAICVRSTFPPLRITPTRAPRIGVVPSSAAAAPSAPVGSTTSLSRSHR